MSALKEKRLKVIERLMRSHGIEHGDKCVISLWDLAFNINNTWKAELFANKNKYSEEFRVLRGRNVECLVLPTYKLSDLFRAIRHALKKNPYPFELRESYYNKSEFVLFKNYTKD